MRGKKSKEVYNYTSIQSIQHTLYSIQRTWVQYTVCKGYSIQYTGYKGIRVYSTQGTKGSGKRVYCRVCKRVQYTVYRVQGYKGIQYTGYKGKWEEGI